MMEWIQRIAFEIMPIFSLKRSSSNFNNPFISLIEFIKDSSVRSSESSAKAAIYISMFISSRFKSKFADNSKDISWKFYLFCKFININNITKLVRAFFLAIRCRAWRESSLGNYFSFYFNKLIRHFNPLTFNISSLILSSHSI